MPKFNQKSPEYISNGHYRINGQEFMSVWTYKNKIGAPTANTTPINGEEGKQLAQRCSIVHSSEPDFGAYKEILIFPVEEMRTFYGN
jgi:hypothetical protein